MPITKSAQKQLRQSAKARVRNTMQKDKARSLLKSIDRLLTNKKTDEAAKKLPEAYSHLDRMVKKNVIHKNKAARKKSQMMKKLLAGKKK